jgi:uncharacterized membrane protein
MSNLPKLLLALAAVAFVLAVVASRFTGTILGIPPEAYSRACNNLALLAIGVSVGWKASSQ